MDALLEKLVKIEAKYRLYEDRIDGVPAWMYIRYVVLQDELMGRREAESLRKRITAVLRGSSFVGCFWYGWTICRAVDI